MTRLARSLTALPDRTLWRLIAGALCLTIAAATFGAHQLADPPVRVDRIDQHQER